MWQVGLAACCCMQPGKTGTMKPLYRLWLCMECRIYFVYAMLPLQSHLLCHRRRAIACPACNVSIANRLLQPGSAAVHLWLTCAKQGCAASDLNCWANCLLAAEPKPASWRHRALSEPLDGPDGSDGADADLWDLHGELLQQASLWTLLRC